jgi:hypothetical protein
MFLLNNNNTTIYLLRSTNMHFLISYLLALPYQDKDIVFRFITEYSSLRDFGSLGNMSVFIRGFLKDDILACVET